jgi:hypothetical protein
MTFIKEEHTDSFSVPSDEAAHILGVNKTRLSQLTSKGIFSYERKNIEGRSRLFYKLGELLSYQRAFSFGSGSLPQTPASLEIHNQKNNVVSTDIPPSISTYSRVSLATTSYSFPTRSMHSALGCFVEEQEEHKNHVFQESLLSEIAALKEEVKELRSSLQDVSFQLHLQLNRIALGQSLGAVSSFPSPPRSSAEVEIPKNENPAKSSHSKKWPQRRKPRFYFKVSSSV